jgi:hypothetical protein
MREGRGQLSPPKESSGIATSRMRVEEGGCMPMGQAMGPGPRGHGRPGGQGEMRSGGGGAILRACSERIEEEGVGEGNWWWLGEKLSWSHAPLPVASVVLCALGDALLERG